MITHQINTFYQTIGREISTNNLNPRCLAIAVNHCGSTDPSRMLKLYTELRLRELMHQWERRRNNSAAVFSVAIRPSVSYQWEKKHIVLWIYLKILMLLGLCGSMIAFLRRSNADMPDPITITGIFTFIAFTLLAPELIVKLAGIKVSKFHQWNYYGAFVSGALSFHQAIQYLKFSYYN